MDLKNQNFTQQPFAKKAKTNRTLFALLSILLVLIIIFGLFFYFYSKENPDANYEQNLDVSSENKKSEPLFVPDELVVEFKSGISEEDTKEFYKRYNLEEELLDFPFESFSEEFKKEVGDFRTLKITDGRSVTEITELLKDDKLLESVEPNYYLYNHLAPNDPLYDGSEKPSDNPFPFNKVNWEGQWNLREMGLENVWDTTIGDPNIIVAVLDSGAAYKELNITKNHSDSWKIVKNVAKGDYYWSCTSCKNHLVHSFDLTKATGDVSLEYYYHFYPIGKTAFGFVEVSKDDGDTWSQLEVYSKSMKGFWGGDIWKMQHGLSMNAYKGKKILVRFRVGGTSRFFVDNIDLMETNLSSATHLFYDGGDSFENKKGWELVNQFYRKAPELESTLFSNGYDFIYRDYYPEDEDGHGTSVITIMASTVNDYKGMSGIANVRYLPIKVMGGESSDTPASLVSDALYYAYKSGANIINMSLGFGNSYIAKPSKKLEKALSLLWKNKTTIIASCGNSGVWNRLSVLRPDDCDYPAAYDDYVIAVGAIDSIMRRKFGIIDESSYGPTLDIVAPGAQILYQTLGNYFTSGFKYNEDVLVGGTSLSAPHVTGLVALLLSKKPDLTPLQVKYILESTAKDLIGEGYSAEVDAPEDQPGWDKYFGCGLVDAHKAFTEGLESIKQNKMPKDFTMEKHGCDYKKCGNGIKETGEQCDDGNTNNLDSCRNNCKFPYCGDSTVDSKEECDDGNNNNGDGCSTSCKKEKKCGNGIKETGEQCDDGNINSGDGCSSSCKNENRADQLGSCVQNYGWSCVDDYYLNWCAGEFIPEKACVDLGYGVCYCGPNCAGSFFSCVSQQTTQEYCDSLVIGCEFYPGKSIKDEPWIN